MINLFFFLGDASLPYRTIMANHTDFNIGDFLVPKSRTVIAEQTHSPTVHICNESDCGAGFDEHPQIPGCDALITNHIKQYLLIRTADCTPVLLYDASNNAVGAIHSGREGTRKNIVAATINAMQNQYNTQPQDLRAWIGAGISKKHYKVDESTWLVFYEACHLLDIDLSKDIFPIIDINFVISQQLLQAGVSVNRINNLGICTFENKSYFSYRRDGTHNRQINIIGLTDG